MAGTAVLGRLTWRLAEVVRLVDETPRVRSIAFDVPGWPGHRAGQHVDVRLTAEDGYQAERSYSIASAPGNAELELTVERLDDGEVSPYLVDELRPGDRIELRGPAGGYFVWTPDVGGPLLRVAGDTGEYWDNSGTSGVKYLIEAGKALVTGSRPDVGQDAKVHAKVEL